MEGIIHWARRHPVVWIALGLLIAASWVGLNTLQDLFRGNPAPVVEAPAVPVPPAQ